MHPRPAILLTTLAAFGLLLGASLAAGLAPVPLPIGAPAAMRQSGPASSGGNDTQPPGNETEPPANETRDPLPAPEVTPHNQSLRGGFGATLAFEVVVRNPAKDAQSIDVTLAAPLGWTARVDAYPAALDARDSFVLAGSVHSSLPGQGVVRIHVQGRDAGSDAYLDVCFGGLVYACPAPGGNSTGGGNNTGGNNTGGNDKPPKNETKPPKNETQPPANETRPPQNETQPPQNDTAEAPATAQASPPGVDQVAPATEDDPVALAEARTLARAGDTLPVPAAPPGEAPVHVI